MESQELQLSTYLTNGVEKIVKGAIRATLTEPRERAFMTRFALASKEASRRRAQAKQNGEHIPPFLIASITSGGCVLFERRETVKALFAGSVRK